jgi:hypothetical protein
MTTGISRQNIRTAICHRAHLLDLKCPLTEPTLPTPQDLWAGCLLVRDALRLPFLIMAHTSLPAELAKLVAAYWRPAGAEVYRNRKMQMDSKAEQIQTIIREAYAKAGAIHREWTALEAEQQKLHSAFVQHRALEDQENGFATRLQREVLDKCTRATSRLANKTPSILAAAVKRADKTRVANAQRAAVTAPAASAVPAEDASASADAEEDEIEDSTPVAAAAAGRAHGRGRPTKRLKLS